MKVKRIHQMKWKFLFLLYKTFSVQIKVLEIMVQFLPRIQKYGQPQLVFLFFNNNNNNNNRDTRFPPSL